MPTLDLMTDVMRQLSILNTTRRYQKNNTEGFVRGSIKLGYDATWSALPDMIDDSREEIRMVPLESAIRAQVNRARLYGWLAMNFTLQIAAALVAIAHRVRAPGQKMTRDPTLQPMMGVPDALKMRPKHVALCAEAPCDRLFLKHCCLLSHPFDASCTPTMAALMMDLDDVKHRGGGRLCSAVALGSRDKKLGKMKWKCGGGGSCEGDDACLEKVVLVQNQADCDQTEESDLRACKSEMKLGAKISGRNA
jgi:hypothetical protein